MWTVLAFKGCTSNECAASWRNWIALSELLKFARKPMIGGQTVKLPIASEEKGTVCLTQPGRRLGEGIQHCLQIEGRAADDLEHVGGGGLLLEQFAQLVEQAGVLDCDDCLGGEILTKPICLSVKGRTS